MQVISVANEFTFKYDLSTLGGLYDNILNSSKFYEGFIPEINRNRLYKKLQE